MNCKKCGNPGKIYYWQKWCEGKLVKVINPECACDNECYIGIGQTEEQAISHWLYVQEKSE